MQGFIISFWGNGIWQVVWDEIDPSAERGHTDWKRSTLVLAWLFHSEFCNMMVTATVVVQLFNSLCRAFVCAPWRHQCGVFQEVLPCNSIYCLRVKFGIARMASAFLDVFKLLNPPNPPPKTNKQNKNTKTNLNHCILFHGSYLL